MLTCLFKKMHVISSHLISFLQPSTLSDLLPSIFDPHSARIRPALPAFYPSSTNPCTLRNHFRSVHRE